MMSPGDVQRAADLLLGAERARSQTGLLSEHWPDAGMDDAYRIQDAVVARKLAEGRRAVGWKIGLTSRAMQQALAIDIPDSGVLLDDMDVPDGSTVPPGRFIQPRIEGEIAFITRRAIAPDAGRDAVLAATEAVVPALEILDTRVLRANPATGRVRTIVDTIADNAANAGFVLGAARHRPDAFDLAWVGAIVRRNGSVEETGLGAGVLGDPVAGIVWLARRLGQYGRRIEAGQVVLSGSFIRPIECPTGSVIDADFGTFGRVGVTFG